MSFFFFLQSHNNNPSEISRLFPFTLLWKQHCLWCQWAMSYDLEECCCHCVSKWWQRWRNCRDRDRPAGREKEKEAERKNNKRCFLSESDNGQVELEHLKKIYLCTKSIKSQHFQNILLLGLNRTKSWKTWNHFFYVYTFYLRLQ